MMSVVFKDAGFEMLDVTVETKLEHDQIGIHRQALSNEQFRVQMSPGSGRVMDAPRLAI